MNRQDVEIVDRSTPFQGYFRIDRYRLKHRLFGGGWSDEIEREIFERGHAAAILLYDARSDALVLIEQFRVGALAAIESGHVGKDITPWLIECAAGIIEDGETPEEVARREVREETGCDVLDIVPALQYLVSPGGTSETIHVFCAHVTAPEPGSIHGIQEEHEDIRVLVVPVAEAFEWLRTGVVINAMTLIALHWFRDNHAGLRQQWKE